MAVSAGPDIVENGLVLCLDAANRRSYPGTGTGWFDLSENLFNSVLVNGTTFSNENNGSMIFDGSNDYISTVTASTLGITSVSSAFSISMWFKTTDTTEKYMFDNYGGNLLCNISLRIDNQKIETYMQGSTSGSSLYQYGSSYGDNNWYNVVLTWSGSSQSESVYINGSFLGSNNRTLTGNFETTVPFYIGSRPFGGGVYQGNISNCMVYSRSLTFEEISQNFNALRGRYNI